MTTPRTQVFIDLENESATRLATHMRGISDELNELDEQEDDIPDTLIAAIKDCFEAWITHIRVIDKEGTQTVFVIDGICRFYVKYLRWENETAVLRFIEPNHSILTGEESKELGSWFSENIYERIIKRDRDNLAMTMSRAASRKLSK